MRTCPFTNCHADLPDHIFACRGHWMSLSPDDRRRIHFLYGEYLADRIGVEDLRKLQQEVLGTKGTA